MQFDDENGFDVISGLAEAGKLDELSFGVIGFDSDDVVTHYNKFEEDAAGISREMAIGHDLFIEVAPCMNNFMVSERFEDESLDEVIDYVLTLKMKPTRVALRLLADDASGQRFIAVKR